MRRDEPLIADGIDDPIRGNPGSMSASSARQPRGQTIKIMGLMSGSSGHQPQDQTGKDEGGIGGVMSGSSPGRLTGIGDAIR
jgi:hypothetical protein